MSSDKEKAESAAKTLKEFCEQFGNDTYSKILLEELFEGLFHEETVFVFGESVQAGDQAGDSSTNGTNDSIKTS